LHALWALLDFLLELIQSVLEFRFFSEKFGSLSVVVRCLLPEGNLFS
jgi:hypothetical protein